MQLRNSRERYGVIAQFFHWSVAILVVVAWVSGMLGEDLPPPLRTATLSMHIWAGLAVLLLTALRIFWRIVDPPPRLETTAFGKWGKRSAGLVHYSLYALLIAVPAVGIGLQFANGNGLSVFGLVNIPSPWAANRSLSHTLEESHELLANAMLVLAGVHAAAALLHHWVIGDRTLNRMLPSDAMRR